METKYFRSSETLIGHSIRLTLSLLLLFTSALSVSAQSIGITSTGTTTYPQTIVGNTSNGNGNDGGNFCIANFITTTVPLTAIAIKTFGTAGGNVKLAIYTDNSGSPGTKIYGETEFTVTANVATISIITNTNLPAGTYWLVYNMNSSSASANFITKNTVSNYTRKSITQNYSAAFPGTNATWTSLANTFQDNIALVGVAVEGYAKATKAVLGTNGIFGSMSFYSHAAGNARLAIYSDASGVPTVKQWESGDVAVSASAWTTVNISSGTPASLNLSAGTYWLAWQWNSAANGPSYTSGAATTGNAIVQAYGAYPSSWLGGAASTENWSIYATYSVCTLPTAYNVTGGGGYCSGGAGVPIGLSNSETGVTYQLYIGGITAVGSNLSGTGLAITFGNQTTAGNYTVVATRTTGGCTNNMNGSATLSINPLPTASASKTDISCFNAGNGQIIVTGANGTAPYIYSINNGSNGGTYQSGSTFNGLAPGQYKIRVKDSNTCESILIP